MLTAGFLYANERRRIINNNTRRRVVYDLIMCYRHRCIRLTGRTRGNGTVLLGCCRAIGLQHKTLKKKKTSIRRIVLCTHKKH